MAGGFRKMMVYLGLVDDEYDDYDPGYEETAVVAPVVAPSGRVRAMPPGVEEPAAGSIRTLPREPMYDPAPATSGVVLRPQVRPVQPLKNPTVHVVEPTEFGDAKEIGERLKSGQPVIVSLVSAEASLGRRLTDFCSGACFMVDATMQRVARSVFLLTPQNVEVSAEEKRRLSERGLYRL